MLAPHGRRYRSDVDRRFLQPGWIAGHLLVFAALLTCLRLGWWQWGRTQETTGTAQNFGYALLWPAFGVAFVYMWVRFLHLEVLKDVEDDEDTERGLRELLDEAIRPHRRPVRPAVRGSRLRPAAGPRRTPGHRPTAPRPLRIPKRTGPPRTEPATKRCRTAGGTGSPNTCRSPARA